MYYPPSEIVPLLRDEYSEYLTNLDEAKNPMRCRDLSLVMWALAWCCDDWDSLPSAWRSNLFYFGQTLAVVWMFKSIQRGPNMPRFV